MVCDGYRTSKIANHVHSGSRTALAVTKSLHHCPEAVLKITVSVPVVSQKISISWQVIVYLLCRDYFSQAPRFALMLAER